MAAQRARVASVRQGSIQVIQVVGWFRIRIGRVISSFVNTRVPGAALGDRPGTELASETFRPLEQGSLCYWEQAGTRYHVRFAPGRNRQIHQVRFKLDNIQGGMANAASIICRADF